MLWRFGKMMVGSRCVKFTSGRVYSSMHLIAAGGILAASSVGYSQVKHVVKAKGESSDIFYQVFMLNYDRVKSLAGGRHRDIVNTQHELGWFPIHIAAANENIRMVRLLLELGSDVNSQDMYTLSPDDLLSEEEALQVRILGQFNNLPNITTRGMLNSLFDMGELAMKHQQLVDGRVSVRLHEFGGHVGAMSDTAGFTALHYAVVLENVELVDLLLAHQADPSVPAKNGHVARDYNNGNLQIEQLLAAATHKRQMEKAQRDKEERRKHPVEAKLQDRIVGQKSAISTVSSALRRKENNWHDEDRPLVFLFLGSSGIGKTELAKAIAHYLFPNDSNATFIRFDMSEYQTKHEVAKFIGSPPGYVGHEEGGVLVEKLRKCPNAVVLLDEVEKAHPDVLTVMLQLFDEGRLTDNKGNTIACKDAIFIMTSNLAQSQIADYGLRIRNIQQDDELLLIQREFNDLIVRPVLKRHFKRDEFLGRINEVVYFLPFTDKELIELVDRELTAWGAKAKSRHNVTLSWDTTVVAEIIKAYNIYYGARSIKYEVDRKLINMIADAWEKSSIKPKDHVHISISNTNQFEYYIK